MESKQFTRSIAVTGGAGFIGSHLLHHMVPKYDDYQFVNIDCLAYAGTMANLSNIAGSPNYIFAKIDIRDLSALRSCFQQYNITDVIHLAAESHVDRSILGPADFISTNINGTFNLLECARSRNASGRDFRFLHVSTDEVFGSLPSEGQFTETSPYRPNSPYAASKASSDHLVRAYQKTYDVDSLITHSSNNFGPFQYPEKLIPLVISNILKERPIPVYGDGAQVRDWMYVEDHCAALDLVFHKGESGATYNVSAQNEMTNIELVKVICGMLDDKLGGPERARLITFVKDRPAHDRRYALDSKHIETELGWKAQWPFRKALLATVEWYLANQPWVDSCMDNNYGTYYEKQYASR